MGAGGFDRLDKFLDSFRRTDVSGNRNHQGLVGDVFGKLLHGVLTAFHATSIDDDMTTGRGELMSNGQPNARRRACDNREFIGETWERRHLVNVVIVVFVVSGCHGSVVDWIMDMNRGNSEIFQGHERCSEEDEKRPHPKNRYRISVIDRLLSDPLATTQIERQPFLHHTSLFHHDGKFSHLLTAQLAFIDREFILIDFQEDLSPPKHRTFQTWLRNSDESFEYFIIISKTARLDSNGFSHHGRKPRFDSGISTDITGGFF